MGADLEVNKIYSFKGKEVEKNNSCTTKVDICALC